MCITDDGMKNTSLSVISKSAQSTIAAVYSVFTVCAQPLGAAVVPEVKTTVCTSSADAFGPS